jgi:hypothetical protein
VPGFRGHLIGGAVTYVALLQCGRFLPIRPDVMLTGFVVCLAGALFPDIDIKSKGQKLFYGLALFVFILLLWYERTDLFIGLSLLATVPLLVKHRGLFHQPWFLIFFSISAALFLGSLHTQFSEFAMQNAFFFLAGTLSHIILDRCL